MRRCHSAPTADATINLSSSDTGEGTVSPASVTFTSVNWNAQQTVTVTGVDDALLDGNQPYIIITAPATSADANYNGLDPANVALTNVDNASSGITVSGISNNTSETGEISMYRWHLKDPVYWSTDARVTIQQIGHSPVGGNRPHTIQTYH